MTWATWSRNGARCWRRYEGGQGTGKEANEVDLYLQRSGTAVREAVHRMQSPSRLSWRHSAIAPRAPIYLPRASWRSATPGIMRWLMTRTSGTLAWWRHSR